MDKTVVKQDENDTQTIPDDLPAILDILNSEPSDTTESSIAALDPSSDSYQRFGMKVVMVVFGGFGLWAMLAPLDSASFATGVVQVAGNRKPVQHLEGGIIERIDVQNGDYVNVGQPLLYLDDTSTKADLGAIEVQLYSGWALLDRLIAERDDLEAVEFSQGLLDKEATSRAAQVAIANERALFVALRKDRLGELAVLKQTLPLHESRLEGLLSVLASRTATANSLAEEVNDLRELLSQGYVDKIRLRQLERTLDSTQADISSTMSNIAGARVSIEETKLRIEQLNTRYKTDVVQKLSQASAAVVDLEQRYAALREKLDRTVIKASATGVVLDLSVTSVGQVIRSGETLLGIVPDSKELLVKAQIAPADIDSVEVGDEAEIRFSAFKRVFTVTGRLTALSADRLIDETTGMPYYDAEVEIDDNDLYLLGDRKILPGMPADVLVKGEARTLFQYLMKPVDNIFSRALIEE